MGKGVVGLSRLASVLTTFACILLVLVACASGGGRARMPGLLTLTSPSFTDDGAIPARHTAYGDDSSPPLQWTNAPEGTRSFALVMEDLDAGSRREVHWVLYNIPASATGLPEGIGGSGVVLHPAEVAGATAGFNGHRETRYDGPEPPRGDDPHRYRFQLYALSLEPDIEDSLNAAALRQVIADSILDQAVLTGRFAAPAE